MELVYSTEDFLLRGKPYPGFPILLHDTMESCVHANSFMRHYLLRGAIGSKRSWPSTGRAMYDYFSFLQVHELNWDDATAHDPNFRSALDKTIKIIQKK